MQDLQLARWDPRIKAGMNANRGQLIEAVRGYITEKKARTENELAAVQTIIGYENRSIHLSR